VEVVGVIEGVDVAVGVGVDDGEAVGVAVGSPQPISIETLASNTSRVMSNLFILLSLLIFIFL